MSELGEKPTTTRIRTVQWIGEDDPDRLDAATVEFRSDGMLAVGTSRAPLWATTWSLECDSRWYTRRLQVRAGGFGWMRELTLERDDAGWSCSAAASETMDERLGELPPPGVTDRGLPADAVDVDLGLCPLTNTMPIRRLGLLDRDVDEHLLTMVWVDVPSLQVVPAEQRYSSRTVAGRRSVRYESELRDFRSDLDVDADGLIVRYPQLARSLSTTDRVGTN